jgi:hypothetical protein
MTEINETLAGHRTVRRIHVDMNERTCRYDLLMELSRGVTDDVVTVLFEDVQNLQLKDFGGGLTEFQHLAVEPDESGWERVQFEVKDIEENVVGFRCGDISVL